MITRAAIASIRTSDSVVGRALGSPAPPYLAPDAPSAGSSTSSSVGMSSLSAISVEPVYVQLAALFAIVCVVGTSPPARVGGLVYELGHAPETREEGWYLGVLVD